MISLTLLLAYAALAYLLASAAYLLITARWGTPFMNAVRKNEKLLQLYTASASSRRKVFMGSLLATVALLVLWRPQLSCT